MQRQPPLAFDLINAAAVFSALNVGSMAARSLSGQVNA